MIVTVVKLRPPFAVPNLAAELRTTLNIIENKFGVKVLSVVRFGEKVQPIALCALCILQMVAQWMCMFLAMNTRAGSLGRKQQSVKS